MSRAQASKHYARILSQWPVDRLRPEISFQSVLKKRLEAAPVAQVNQANTAQTQAPKARNELREINALYSLLENRYSSTYPLSNAMMHPASAPEHYTTLVKELDEVPDRTFFQRIASRFKGMVRLQ
ncbi:hypothetical protein D6C84_03874 [Aureobasidium pullulans]|uniref:Uncharacterized protein n=1 Tax=Aureobasidium pullulans TaxID=5580 RepID=A0A1A7MLT6_AURPU|nr:hypothetical protein JADG_006005 [Aureobasidium pullulans]OBW67682.1 MAG: Uncharacterized protein AUREO_022570 [Aureobasidium pullulans]THV74676.1 hypothetical protein D6D28_02376 [Aureobasidium pullulans]THV86805.1 hypothetical protein D6D27_07578 [Aureobasidium pullulans]THW07821.1 hypothetical protein D6D26_00730 [Aureobasidium pullulans]